MLRRHAKVASVASARLDRLLGGLGFTEGDLAERLDLAIEAVAAAKRRSVSVEDRDLREELEGEISAMANSLATDRRPSWDGTPDPTSAPVDRQLLAARRNEVAEAMAATEVADLADAVRRMGLMEETVRTLEGQLLELGAGPPPRDQRLRERVLRTAALGGVEQTLPVVVDDVLDGLSASDQLEVLDLMARLSGQAQVIVLSADPVVAGWARGQVGGGAVTLLEADVAVSV